MKEKEEFLSLLEEVTDIASLHQLKSAYIGKKGQITQSLKSLSSLSLEEKQRKGSQLNEFKKFVQAQTHLAEKKISTEKTRQHLFDQIPDPALNLSESMGHVHPIKIVMNTIVDFFIQQGFSVAQGPQIETEYHNFEALNIPDHHPARLMHDSFYLRHLCENVLRTHTSPVQSRYLEQHRPPIKMIAPGRVYRCDNDPTHSPMFHQVEGLVIDTHSNIQDLKDILSLLLSTFFEKEVQTRFRSSYFPFTEPSMEVDITCFQCGGKGCSLCKDSGWIEVLGCGLVHPKVLQNAGICSDHYQGYAFGLGVERFAMLKYSIADLRLFYENHLDFLRQF